MLGHMLLSKINSRRNKKQGKNSTVKMLVRAAYSIFFLFIWCYLSLGYITRLHCRRHGNFSIIKLNTRFNGTAEKSMDGLTRSECVLSCLTCDSCSFVNYHATNLACELMNSEGNETPEEGWQFLSTNYGTRNRGPICRSISPCALTEACVDTCFEDDQVGYKCIPNQFKKLPPAIMGAYPHDVSHPIGYLQDGKDYTYAGALGATNSHFVIHFSTTIPVRFVTIRLQSTVQKGVITVDNKICSWIPELAGVEFVVECNSYLSGRIIVFRHLLGSSQSLAVNEWYVYGDL